MTIVGGIDLANVPSNAPMIWGTPRIFTPTGARFMTKTEQTLLRNVAWNTAGILGVGVIGVEATDIIPYVAGLGTAAKATVAGGTIAGGAVVGTTTLAAVGLTTLPAVVKTAGQVGIAALTLDYMQKNPLVVLGIAAAVIGFLVLRSRK